MATAALCPTVGSLPEDESVLLGNVLPSDPFIPFATEACSLLDSDALVLLTTLPSGTVRVCRTFNFSSTRVKQFHSSLSQEPLVWNTLLQGFIHTHQPELLSSSVLTVGYVSAVTLRIDNPVFLGYPGVLLAVRTTSREYPLQSEPESQVTAVREIFDRTFARKDLLPSLTKYFVLDQKGACLLGQSGLEQLDPVLREHLLEYVSKTPLNQPSSSGRRIMLRDTQGQFHAFHFFRTTGGIVSDQPFWVVTVAPSLPDWESVQLHTFQADPDLRRFVPAIHFMLQNLHTCPDISQIARTIRLSPFHFHRKFTTLFGITPKRLLVDLQIQTAQTLLLTGKLSLQDIARRCGFAHQSHFTSRFKQAVGMTPSCWRSGKLAKRSVRQNV